MAQNMYYRGMFTCLKRVKYEFCKLLDNVQSNFARTVIQAKTLGVC